MGVSAKSVGWPTEASQLLRFQKLSEVMSDLAEAEKVTVNDLGCGYGAMFDYLDAYPRISLDKFYGYDISPEMLHAARTQVSDSRAVWLDKSKLETKADFSFASGIFNVRFETDTEKWEVYVKEMLDNLNEFSAHGFAFNILSTYVDWQEPHLYYADPMSYFHYCKQRYSKKIALLHDYPLYEWTLLVKK